MVIFGKTVTHIQTITHTSIEQKKMDLFQVILATIADAPTLTCKGSSIQDFCVWDQSENDKIGPTVHTQRETHIHREGE